jgi:RHS repeat-associated protein
MQRMVASSIPNNTVPTSTRAQTRGGGWIASSDNDVADTPTSTLCTIASIHETPADSSIASMNLTGVFCCNQQYSVTAITTSTGAIAERYAYTAYGQPTILNASGTVISATTLSNRYTYTGREWDATLGLHHFRARWMSPSAGRFLGRDPIGYLSGTNLLSFCYSKVFRYMDPSGYSSCAPYFETTDVASRFSNIPPFHRFQEDDELPYEGWDGIPFFGIDYWKGRSWWGALVGHSTIEMLTLNETTFLDGGFFGNGLVQTKSQASVKCSVSCYCAEGRCLAQADCQKKPANGKDDDEKAGSASISMVDYDIYVNGPTVKIDVFSHSLWTRHSQSVGIGLEPIGLPIEIPEEVVSSVVEGNLPIKKSATWICKQ